jgi:hypothetical protein
MHRDVGRLRHQLSVRVEYGARVVAALLDVGRRGGPAEDHPHGFGDAGQAVVGKLQFDRVQLSHGAAR